MPRLRRNAIEQFCGGLVRNQGRLGYRRRTIVALGCMLRRKHEVCISHFSLVILNNSFSKVAENILPSTFSENVNGLQQRFQTRA
jgi:hypothetical protein